MKNKGFTLMEVIVAMVIFSSVVLASIAFFSYGQKQGVKAKEVNYAIQLAEEEIEILKTRDYSNITGSSAETFSRYGTTFNINYAASELYTYSESYKVVTVTVTWSSGGRQRDIQLFTIISPDHLNYSGSELYGY